MTVIDQGVGAGSVVRPRDAAIPAKLLMVGDTPRARRLLPVGLLPARAIPWHRSRPR